MAEEDYSARRMGTPGVWSVWVHGGKVSEDLTTKTAFIGWPDDLDLIVPKRYVLVTERAYAELTKMLMSSS